MIAFFKKIWQYILVKLGGAWASVQIVNPAKQLATAFVDIISSASKDAVYEAEIKDLRAKLKEKKEVASEKEEDSSDAYANFERELTKYESQQREERIRLEEYRRSGNTGLQQLIGRVRSSGEKAAGYDSGTKRGDIDSNGGASGGGEESD